MNKNETNEKHISLDFWGTLVFSNNNFRDERAKFLSIQLNKNKELKLKHK